MANTGQQDPGTEVEDTSVGTVAWNSYTDSLVNDPWYDNVTLRTQTSHYIKVTNYGFALPASAVVTGVWLQIAGWCDVGLGASWRVRLVKGGIIQGDTKTAAIPAVLAYVWIGGDGVMWGLTLADTDVEAANFGCVVQVNPSLTPSAIYYCGHIPMVIYYTVPATGVTGAIIC